MRMLHPAHPDFKASGFMGGLVRMGVVFDPATALLVASTAVSAMGAIQQGNAQSASYKAQAAASETNAKIQENNAARVSLEASLREDNMRREQSKFLGRQRASFAESGTGLGTGSNLDVQKEDTQAAELDALTLRYEGDTERYGLLTDASMSRYDAGVSRMNASSAKTAGYIGALGSVLGGAGRYTNSANAAAAVKTPTTSSLPWQQPGNVRPASMGGGYY